MKNTLILTAFSLVFLSCEKDNPQTLQQRTNTSPITENPHTTSYIKWTNMKQHNGNSYSYKTSMVSWVGFGSTTEITVKDNQVISRAYKEFDPSKKVTYAFFESKEELGTNKKGTAPLSIDELYNTCAKEYLLADDKTNTITFKTDSDGILQACGITPKNCADDCYTGFSIESITWPEKPVH